jgi:AcrR family transcriptional regulator
MSETRQKLIESGTRRFYREGFRNVGLDQILADVGISKTAFYKHFESKEDLLLAILNEQHQWMEQTFLEKVREQGGESPLGQLRALFDVVGWIISRDDFHGCIFVNVSMEFPLLHDPAHQAAARSKQAFEAVVRQIATQGGAAAPGDLAAELCLVIEGAYVTKHVTGNAHTLDIARRVGERVILAHLGPAAQLGPA